ncbi:restriction endonuclease subunit S [Clostridium perfringens]|uniref:restriction endonuclease subunit S n=1 Tax=Clostridium perfringens TaxID=1502 RepID=UPI0039E854A2
MFGNPVSNPKGWEKVALIDLGELARGKSKHRPRNAPELMNGPYPLIQTGDVANAGIYIKEYTQTYSELGLQQSKMWKAGTLCITIAANIAKTTILTFDACFPDSIVAFIPNEKTNTMFIQFWMSFLQKILEDSAPESAQKNINLKILGEQRVIVPPIEFQNQFADFVKQVDKLKFEMERV